MTTLARHPLSAVEASAICAGLHDQGIDVAVQIIDRVAHLYPAEPVGTYEEVTALAAFIRVTDSRLAWHARRPDAGWHA